MSGNGTVVFHHEFSENAWLGGSHYFNNLRHVTSRYCKDLEVVGLNLNNCPTIYSSLISRLKMAWFNRFVHKVPASMLDSGRENFLKQKAQGKRMCIYSTNYEHLKPFQALPLIYWIPDFQVMHLPQFFTADDIEYRKANYRKGGELATLIVLSSEAARQDLVKFYPALLPKARVMHFVSELPETVFEPLPNYVCKKYDLPEKFLYVPNQYWQHKNHALIVNAIALLTKEIPDLHIVFSGSQSDSRNPGHSEFLKNLINSTGVRSNISELGIVPKEDVYALMRQSCCLINVSKFEGWSSTVEEAKAIGKPLVLSSIDVHIEQNPPHALYVGVDDVSMLAGHISEVWKMYPSGPNQDNERIARENITERLSNFAHQFEQIINEAFVLKHK